MFRKDPQIKALSNLKSSERRRMLASIVKTYNLPENISKETEEKILPSTVKQTTFRTIKGLAGTVYTDEDQTPIWFKTKDSELIPSVYTLWKAPFILPIVLTHPHVIGVLEGGADLMLPGTVPPFDARIKKGSIVGVADTQDPLLVKGVGRSNYKLSDFSRTIGTTGVAVELYHTNGDMLAQLAKKKISIPEELDLSIGQLEINEPSEANEEQQEGENEPLQEEQKEEIQESVQEEVEGETTEKSEDAEYQLTTEDNDIFFKRSLFQTLTSEIKIEYPLPASNFMDHIVTNLPINHPSLNIKKTSWKKSAKFFKAMEKEGFLKLKGKGDDISIVSTAKKENNEDLRNFVPYKVKKIKTTAASTKASSETNSLKIEKYYKPNSAARQIFNDLDLIFTQYYSSNDVKEILNNYISKHKLVNERNKKMILIDDNLSQIVPNQASIGRDKILAAFLTKFTEFFKIVNPKEPNDSSPPQRGPIPQVQIVTETKIGRKVITRISNFEKFGINPEEFSNELKVKCSGSSTIGNNVQNPKLVEVTVQGPHSKIAIDMLTKKYGLNPNWIKFDDKSKPKKKRTTPAA